MLHCMEGVGHHTKIALLGVFEQGHMNLHMALVGPGLDMLAAELGIDQPALGTVPKDSWTFSVSVWICEVCLQLKVTIVVLSNNIRVGFREDLERVPQFPRKLCP